MQKPRPKVTIYTIAQDVGVSAAAVSIILSNKQTRRRISEATTQKIRESAQRLGYVPNLVGRELRTQTGARQIDLAIATSFEAPLSLVGEWVNYLHKSFRTHKNGSLRMGVAIELFHAGKFSELAPLLHASRYNGVLVTNTSPEDDRFLESAHFPLPLVSIGRHLKNHVCVTEPFDAVGKNAADLLFHSGAKKPAIMYADGLSELTRNRLSAFCKQWAELSGRPPEQIHCENLSMAAGSLALRTRFAARKQRPDALFSVTDSLLLGAYRVLHELSLKIPDDISVVGIGDYETANFYDPALTTLADTHSAIEQAVPLLLKIIQGHHSPIAKTLDVKLSPVFRGSVRNEAKWRIPE